MEEVKEFTQDEEGWKLDGARAGIAPSSTPSAQMILTAVIVLLLSMWLWRRRKPPTHSPPVYRHQPSPSHDVPSSFGNDQSTLPEEDLRVLFPYRHQDDPIPFLDSSFKRVPEAVASEFKELCVKEGWSSVRSLHNYKQHLDSATCLQDPILRQWLSSLRTQMYPAEINVHNITPLKQMGGDWLSVYSAKWKINSGREIEVVYKNLPTPEGMTATTTFTRTPLIPPHENVARLYGVVLLDDGTVYGYAAELRAKGNLLEKLSSPVKFSERATLRVLLGVAKGLRHLHQNEIIHGDVFARNVFVTTHLVPVLADFGLPRGSSRTLITPTIRTGRAPEVLQTGVLTFESDVYSLGVLVWEMANPGKPIPDTLTFKKQPKSTWIAAKCCNADPMARPTLDEVIEMCTEAIAEDQASSDDPLDEWELHTLFPYHHPDDQIPFHDPDFKLVPQAIANKFTELCHKERWTSLRLLIANEKRRLKDSECLQNPILRQWLSSLRTQMYPVEINLRDIVRGNWLGRFDGSVYSAKWQINTKRKIRVAYKKLRRLSVTAADVTTWTLIPPHENVARLYGAVFDFGDVDGFVAELLATDTLVERLELGKLGELMGLSKRELNELTDPTERAILRVLLGVAQGLRHLHQHNIIHGDIFARNILLNKQLVPVITDFGSPRRHSPQVLVSIPRGTAPEVFQRREFTFESDVYSLGLLVWEMSHPGKPLPNTFTFNWGTASNKIAVKCCNMDPKARPTIDQVIEMCTQAIAKVDGTFSGVNDIMNESLGQLTLGDVEQLFASPKETLTNLSFSDFSQVCYATGISPAETLVLADAFKAIYPIQPIDQDKDSLKSQPSHEPPAISVVSSPDLHKWENISNNISQHLVTGNWGELRSATNFLTRIEANLHGQSEEGLIYVTEEPLFFELAAFCNMRFRDLSRTPQSKWSKEQREEFNAVCSISRDYALLLSHLGKSSYGPTYFAECRWVLVYLLTQAERWEKSFNDVKDPLEVKTAEANTLRVITSKISPSLWAIYQKFLPKEVNQPKNDSTNKRISFIKKPLKIYSTTTLREITGDEDWITAKWILRIWQLEDKYVTVPQGVDLSSTLSKRDEEWLGQLGWSFEKPPPIVKEQRDLGAFFRRLDGEKFKDILAKKKSNSLSNNANQADEVKQWLRVFCPGKGDKLFAQGFDTWNSLFHLMGSDLENLSSPLSPPSAPPPPPPGQPEQVVSNRGTNKESSNGNVVVGYNLPIMSILRGLGQRMNFEKKLHL